jgi:hypothetical protein
MSKSTIVSTPSIKVYGMILKDRASLQNPTLGVLVVEVGDILGRRTELRSTNAKM